ncbi:MAG: hypothetical protein OK438_00605 [Thaumarchaeota archaeon]|nr:hypothetical protein [Nitrososphaerota archaeon]
MLEIGVLIERIDGARLSDKVTENSASNYGLNVSLSERERSPASLLLSFTLELTSQPQLARILVSGITTLTGTKDEIQGALAAPDDTNPPLVLATVYERIYGLVYLVAEGLKIPRPLPTLLKTAPDKK